MSVRSVQRSVSTPTVRTAPAGPGWIEHRAPAHGRAFVRPAVVARIRELNAAARPNEIAGLLVGRRFSDAAGPYVVVTDLVAHQPGEIINGPARVQITAQGAYRMQQRALQRHPLGDIVGWWHTHPEFAPYFSAVDRAEQRHWSNPTSVGLVLSGCPGDGPEWMVYLGPDSVESRQETRIPSYPTQDVPPAMAARRRPRLRPGAVAVAVMLAAAIILSGVALVTARTAGDQARASARALDSAATRTDAARARIDRLENVVVTLERQMVPGVVIPALPAEKR